MQIAAEVIPFFYFFFPFYFNAVLVLQRDLCSRHRNLCAQRPAGLASAVGLKMMPQLSNVLCCFLFSFLSF